MELPAYAKINLLLSVRARRQDGYHEIESVMQTLDLHDRLDIRLTDSGKTEIRCSRPYVPTDERNLIWKAAARFYEKTGVSMTGLSVRLEKNIPVGAGLGGGSSDAAAALTALNSLHHMGLPKEELAEIAAGIGADVPFFIFGGACLARGIGEKLTPIPSLPNLPVLIVKPPFSVSTPKAYAAFDEYGTQLCPDTDVMLRAMQSGSLGEICAALGNSLEAPVCSMHPKITEIREKLLSLGARGAMMSGAGSAVFALFGSFQEAKKAREALAKDFGRCFLTRPAKAAFN